MFFHKMSIIDSTLSNSTHEYTSSECTSDEYTSDDSQIESTMIAFEQDFIEEQAFITKQDFGTLLDMDQMERDFAILHRNSASIHNDELHWHSSLIIGYRYRLRARYLSMIDKITGKMTGNIKASENKANQLYPHLLSRPCAPSRPSEDMVIHIQNQLDHEDIQCARLLVWITGLVSLGIMLFIIWYII